MPTFMSHVINAVANRHPVAAIAGSHLRQLHTFISATCDWWVRKWMQRVHCSPSSTATASTDNMLVESPLLAESPSCPHSVHHHANINPVAVKSCGALDVVLLEAVEYDNHLSNGI